MSSSIMKSLREKSNKELTDIINKIKTQLLEIRFSAANGDTEKVKLVKDLKKTVARVLTILNERESEENK